MGLFELLGLQAFGGGVVFKMYVALYRKWRPRVFDDVVSQEHITLTLKNEIKANKIAHAYLFTGSRGTGKTTCAKIFSRAINCLDSADGEPCGRCEICKGLENGSVLDVVEMDGASNNSVNDVRILRDEASFVPGVCRYRVYIIDEAHMLSNSAFNALLKIMEEPPGHVVFILATTEIHKIPATVLSRCQRFDFHRVCAKAISNRLLYISSKEDFTLTKDASEKIAMLSDGSVRDAISILDQCAACADCVDLKTVNDVLGLVDKTYILNLHEAFKSKNASCAIKIIDSLYQNSKDMGSLCEELIQFYRQVMLLVVLGSDSDLGANCGEFYDAAKAVSKSLDLKDVVEFLDSFQKCSDDLKNSSNKRLGLELCVLKLCCDFEPESSRKSEISGQKFVNMSKKGDFGLKIPETPSDFQSPDLASNDVSPQNLTRNAALNAKPLDSWQDILDDLRDVDQAGMLSGFLAGSRAFVIDDRLFIDSQSPIVSDMVLKKKTLITSVITKRTGKKYRIFLKKSKNNRHDENKLEKILQSAKKAGIVVDEE